MNISSTLIRAIVAYYAGTLVVVLGVILGYEHLAPERYRPTRPPSIPAAVARQDANWYSEIAKEGYRYDPAGRSNVAFFPLFPLLGCAAAVLLRSTEVVGLLVVSQVCLLATYVAFQRYLQARSPNDPSLVEYSLLALVFWPPTFFFRLPYSESLFALLCILFLHSLVAKKSLWWTAALCGLATATRPVGIGLVIPFAVVAARKVLAKELKPLSFALVLLVSISGLLTFMAYQQFALGDALAFARAQEHWQLQSVPAWRKLLALLTFEPLWVVYTGGPLESWQVQGVDPLLNLQLANPLYVFVAVVSVGWGSWNRWLTWEESLTAAALILVPYVTKSIETGMASQGRYVSVAMPMYLVPGELLRRLGPEWSVYVVAPAALLMGLLLHAALPAQPSS
ncbi:MAG: hypothetical protein U0836_17690 [Pirellulales bacterium]